MITKLKLCSFRPVVCVWMAILPGAFGAPIHDGKTVLFGNLHAHSKLSDDIRNAGDDMLPIEAFRYAQAHGLDFLAITDHQQATNCKHRLFMAAGEYRRDLFDAAMNYNATNGSGFIAIPGIEWGTMATGNHINLIGARSLPPDTTLDAEYEELYAWAKGNCEFLQFNHPHSWPRDSKRNKQVGNYGEKRFADKGAFLTAAGSTVRTISIISTVRGGHLSGEHRESTAKTHREMEWENYYKSFLNAGFHISPAANQDTHGKNWGTVTAARTAVWSDTRTYGDLMNAFRANRVYTSEDDEMVVVFQVNYANSTHWMGETVNLNADEDDASVIVMVWQADGGDGDAVEEGPYTVELISDGDGVGGREAAVLETIEGIPSKEQRTVPIHVRAGEYVYLRVTEEAGKDNAIGDGDDEVNNSTGADEGDGKRDDLNDSAWTSPIWFARAATTFTWSVNSDLYHDSLCWAAVRIGTANKRSGSEPPGGKTKHNCKPPGT